MRQQEGDGPPSGVFQAHPYQKTQAKNRQTYTLSLNDNCVFETQSPLTEEISNMIQQDFHIQDTIILRNGSQNLSKVRQENKKKVKQKVDTLVKQQEDPLVQEEKEPNGQKIKPDKGFYKSFVKLPFKTLEKEIGLKEFQQIAKGINLKNNIKEEREFFLYLVKIRLNFEQIWDLFKNIILKQLEHFLKGKGQDRQRKEKKNKICAYIEKLDIKEIQQAFQICFGQTNHQHKKATKQYNLFKKTQKSLKERKTKKKSKSNQRK